MGKSRYRFAIQDVNTLEYLYTGNTPFFFSEGISKGICLWREEDAKRYLANLQRDFQRDLRVSEIMEDV